MLQEKGVERPCATGISDTTRCMCRLVESAVCAATVGGLHAAANKPVIFLEGALPPSLSATPFSCQCIGCCCRVAPIWQEQSGSARKPEIRCMHDTSSLKPTHLSLLGGAGINHAQFGNDKRNAARGDIKAAVSYEEARQKIAQVREMPLNMPCL
jgi:hypothetical protein